MDDCGTAGSAALYARAYEVAHSSDRLNSARHEANGQPHMKLRFYVYPVHVMTRKSFGLMMRKLSVTESQRSAQFPEPFHAEN